MGIFDWGETVAKGMEVIDKAFYTDQERAEQKSKLLEDLRGFKVVQRFLAKEVMKMFKILLIVEVPLALSSVFFEKAGEALKALNTLEAVQILGWSYLAVMALYFTGGVIGTPLKFLNKQGQ